MAEKKLSKEEVLKIARLARLSLSDEEVTFYQARLERVLGYVRELDELETSKLAFAKHIPPDAEPFANDEPVPHENRTALMENAPETESNCFVLPSIMESSP